MSQIRSKEAWRRVNVPRKIWHATGGLFVISVLLLTYPSKRLAFQITVVVGILMLIIDIVRFSSYEGRSLFQSYFGHLTGKKEEEGPNASFFYAVSILIALLLFSPRIAMGAIASLAIGDPVAAIVGIMYGRHRIKGKSIEGAAANAIVSFALIIFFVRSPIVAAAGALAGAIVELMPIPKVDDNLSVPIVSGLAMTIAQSLIS
jgi:dolichol kinase